MISNRRISSVIVGFVIYQLGLVIQRRNTISRRISINRINSQITITYRSKITNRIASNLTASNRRAILICIRMIIIILINISPSSSKDIFYRIYFLIRSMSLSFYLFYSQRSYSYVRIILSTNSYVTISLVVRIILLKILSLRLIILVVLVVIRLLVTYLSIAQLFLLEQLIYPLNNVVAELFLY